MTGHLFYIPDEIVGFTDEDGDEFLAKLLEAMSQPITDPERPVRSMGHPWQVVTE